VRDSDATLLLVRGGIWDSAGTTFTRACAELVFEKPFHLQDLNAAEAFDRVSGWMALLAREAPRGEFVLNIAGPRESESPGIYAAALPFLQKVLHSLVND
jgi:hypothetical protein